jgi:hypothetical protein
MKMFKRQRYRELILTIQTLLYVLAALFLFEGSLCAWAADFEPATYTRFDALGRRIIHVPAGVFTVSRPIELSSDTILEGEGITTVLTPATSFSGSRFITNKNSVFGNRNIVLRNLHIRFTGPQLSGDMFGIVRFYHAENLQISNINMSVDSPMYAIDLSNQIYNAIVEGCTITNINKTSGGAVMVRNGDPLSTQPTSSVFIRNNRFMSVSDEAISLFGWLGEEANITVQGNAVQVPGASFGIVVYGVDARKQTGTIHDVRIIDNTISGSKVGGIGVKGGASTVEVTGNTIRDTEGDGIFLHPGGEGLPEVRNVRLIGNAVVNAGRHGMLVGGQNVEVRQNSIRHCRQSGIFAAGPVFLTGNTITEARPSILLYGGREELVTDNTLSNDGRILILNKDGAVVKDVHSQEK